MKNKYNNIVIVDNQHNIEQTQYDVLLLIRTLEGRFNRIYDGYSSNIIDTVIIYAEFDRIYHFEHSKYENGCYLCMDNELNEERWLTQAEYLQHLRSIIANNLSKVTPTSENNGNGRLEKVNKLKHKVDNTFKVLNYIIDGIDFLNKSYKDAGSKSKCKQGKVTTETKHQRERVISKKVIGKVATRRSVYEYKQSITPYVKMYFNRKIDARLIRRIDTETRDNIERKTEVINILTSSRDKQIIEKIRELEKEIEIEDNRTSSYEDAIISKYKNALRLAMILSDPNEVAMLYIKYTDFISSLSESSLSESTVMIGSMDDNDDLLNQCLEIIKQNTSRSYAELTIAAKTYDNDWAEQIKKGFECQIKLLRGTGSYTLVDVLHTYAVFCLSVYDFETAEKCLIECRDIHVREKSPKSALDLVITYSNLCKLNAEWRRIDDAIENGELAIKYLKRYEIFAYNGSLNIHYANLYNLVSVSYHLQNEHQKADEYNKIATDYICKEDDSKVKVLYLHLMIVYNYGVFRMTRKNYFEAYVGIELLYWKCMLLCKMDDSEDYLELKGNYENAMARCEMHLKNYEDAKYYVEEGLKTYGELCEKNHVRYAINRLYLLQTLADIYDEDNLNDKAEEQYLSAISEAQQLIDSGIYVAKGRLYEMLTNLAGLYNKTGNYHTAIEICKKVLTICDELIYLDHDYYTIEIIKGLDNIAITYYNFGDTKSAIKACQDALLKCDELEINNYNIETIGYWKSKIRHDMGLMM